MDDWSAIPDAILAIVLLIISATILGRVSKQNAKALKDRLPSFDFLKGVCIVIIVMVHARDVAPMPALLAMVLWLAVPAFIFASGYLTYHRHPDSAGKGYFWGIWWRIGLPYLMFTALWMLWTRASLAGLPLDLLLGRADGGNLYFIPLLLSLYAIYPLLQEIQRRAGWLPFLLMALCFSAISEYADLQYNSVSWDANPVSLAFFGRLLFVFAAGMFFASRELKAMMGLVPALASMAITVAAIALAAQGGFQFSSFFFGPVAFSVLLIAVYGLLAERAGAIGSLFSRLGEGSFIIYLTHSAIIYYVLKPFFGSYLGTDWVFFVIVAAAVAMGYACAIVFRRAYGELLKAAGVLI